MQTHSPQPQTMLEICVLIGGLGHLAKQMNEI